MVRRGMVALSLGVALVGCDTDEDGLTNAEEAALGTDPESADTDGDGLSDADEVALGTDPLSVDTDADGYADDLEVDAGTDPRDPDDVIYEGGWPYFPDKDDLSEPGPSGKIGVGERIPRVVAVDQYGQDVDLYDFAGQGKLVVLDVSAMWCGPCHEMAEWMAGGSGSYFRQYDDFRDLVDAGEIIYITVLHEDYDYNETSDRDVRQWDRLYPNPRVPVLTDPGKVIGRRMPKSGMPRVYLLSEDLELLVAPGNVDWYRAFDEAVERAR